MNEKVAGIVASYLKQFTDTKFFSAPGIPPKKLRNAIKAYAPDTALLALQVVRHAQA